MRKYYCHQCAVELSLLNAPPFGRTVGSQYQLEKYIKHTNPDPNYDDVQSVFAMPGTQAYREYLLDAMAAGSVEIDERGRKNIVWAAGKDTGFRYESGRLVKPLDAVKVVLSSDTGKVHAFPDSSTSFNSTVCVNCGKMLVY